jgi:hypothetical protein
VICCNEAVEVKTSRWDAAFHVMENADHKTPFVGQGKPRKKEKRMGEQK